MVRSATTPCVSNHEATEFAAILRDARKSALLNDEIGDTQSGANWLKCVGPSIVPLESQLLRRRIRTCRETRGLNRNILE
jgi:hypothetical protein